MNKRLIVLGLSTYNEFLVRCIYEHDTHGQMELIVVDKDEEKINAITDFVSQPIIGNATNHDLLKQLNVQDADYVIVSLGSIESSLICVLYLQELQARHIIVKALNSEHDKILRLLKVDEVVFPEKLVAELSSIKLLHPNILAARALSDGDSIVEIALAESLVGTRLDKLEIEKQYDLNVVSIIDGKTRKAQLPADDYTIKAGDTLIMAGSNKNLYKFGRMLGKQ